MKFLKNNVCSLFFLHENRDGHLAGLMEAKPEVLARYVLILYSQIEKMCHCGPYGG